MINSRSCTPKKSIFNYATNQKLWELSQKKKHFQDKWVTTKCDDWRMFYKHFAKKLCTEIELAHRQAKKREIRSLSNTFKNDKMRFWQRVKQIKRTRKRKLYQWLILYRLSMTSLIKKLIFGDDEAAKIRVKEREERIKNKLNSYSVPVIESDLK